MPSKPTYKLVTVNSAPERAKKLVGRVIRDLENDKYAIKHVDNAESPEVAKDIFKKHVPDMVFTASMWTPEQSSKVLAEAREVNPKVKTLAIPQGMQVKDGPDAVVEWLKKKVPELLGDSVKVKERANLA